jgi:glucosamine--fructose-6-phosphate aminotransferase (isomerizing)
MDPDAFLADLEAKPTHLRDLADRLDAGTVLPASLATSEVRRVVCTGMGSSRFAALPITGSLRTAGIDAAAEYASLERGHPGGPGTVVVGISATGATEETVASLEQRAEGTTRVAVTNDPTGPLASVADHVVDLGAGVETGGVACSTFQHTLVVLLALVDAVTGQDRRVADVCRRAADATEELLERRDRWLPAVVEVLEASPATYLLAPAERRSSAEQGALMLREGPRRMADACETGDWLHVDVYLSKPLDYRCVLFAGSRYDDGVFDWLEQRDGRCVAVGADRPRAAVSVRYRHDDEPLVALLTEVLVPELLAATWWAAAAS